MRARFEIERRRDAAEATLARFRDRPFVWGQWDCARLVAFHLRKLGQNPPLAKAGSYKTALGARAALKRIGAADLATVLDGMGLQRIAPAAAVVGDVVELPGDEGFGSMTVALGLGRVVGWHQDATGAAVLQPVQFKAAWRVR